MPQSPYLIVNTATVPNLSVSVDKSGQFSYFNCAENAWRQVSDQASIDEIKAAMPNALFVPGGTHSPAPPPPPLPELVDRMDTRPSPRQPSPETPAKLALPPPLRRRKPRTSSNAASRGAIRRRGDEHVKRPPNSFILFRSANLDAIRAEVGILGQRISQRAGEMWKNAPEQVRASFEKQALEEKEKHQQLYPDYKFDPNKARTAD